MTSHRASSSASQGDASASVRLSGPPLTHYQLLEVSPEVTPLELRQAFRSLSKRYHPDTTTLPAGEAREAFARLRQAYAVLADPVSRGAYDAQLRQPPQPRVPVPPLPTGPAAAARPIGVRRSLSGGEWFALVLLGLALALSLVLGVGLAWARGAALITRPSWWNEAAPPVASLAAPISGVSVPSGQTSSGLGLSPGRSLAESALQEPDPGPDAGTPLAQGPQPAAGIRQAPSKPPAP